MRRAAVGAGTGVCSFKVVGKSAIMFDEVESHCKRLLIATEVMFCPYLFSFYEGEIS